MKTAKRFTLLFLFTVCLMSTQAIAQWSPIAPGRLISPEDLAKMLQSGKEKPLMLQVGSHMLFLQAHIPRSEYVGPGATKRACSNSVSAWRACPATNSLFSTADAVPGITAQTSNPQTMPCTLWASPTSRCCTLPTISEPTGWTRAIRLRREISFCNQE